jgi:capsular polysaccharide biosynthesis protein
MTTATTSTEKVRAELANGYCYVRNMEERGGVIDAIVSDRKAAQIASIINGITNESFSQVWSSLMQVKGVKFSYQSN